jgi:hypothetical protein
MPIIQATWEVNIKRISVLGQLEQTKSQTPSPPIGGLLEHSCLPSYVEGINRRTEV